MDDRKIGWYQTLRAKLIAIIILTTSVVLIALAYASYKYIEANKFDELAELTNVSANRISRHLVTPMWTLDREQVDDLVKVEMEEQRVAAIVIRDEDRRTLFLARERGPGDEAVESIGSITGDLLSADRDVIKDGKRIGAVSVYVTKQFTLEELRQFKLGVVMTALILNLVIFIAMMFAISKFVLVPLEKLTNIAVKISDGQINQVIDVTSTDEIGDLAIAFQKMQTSLKIIMRRFSRNRRI